jgi:hypothetical protein
MEGSVCEQKSEWEWETNLGFFGVPQFNFVCDGEPMEDLKRVENAMSSTF